MDWHCVQVDLVTGGGDREAAYLTAGRLQCGARLQCGRYHCPRWSLPQQPLEAHCALLAKR